MAGSRLRPLTVKEIEQRTATRPLTIRHMHLGGVAGFVLVHTPAGHKGYALFYRYGGKLRKLTLGSTKMLSLADARSLAGKHRAAVEAGKDPHGEKVSTKRDAAEQVRLMPEQLWVSYMTLAAAQLRSRGEKDRIFRKYILPGIRKVAVSDIAKKHALDVIDPLVAGGKLRMADKVRQEGAAWFEWLIERDHVSQNPFAGLRKAQPGRVVRDRVLSDEELVGIWRAAEPEGSWGSWIKLLILTGARNAEARCAFWSEFDLVQRIWTIPAARSKNKQPHRVHLSELALSVLNDLPRFDGTDLLFPAKGRLANPMSGDQSVKNRIDARWRKAVAAAGGKGPGQWQYHDFRRTVATGLQRLGFRPDVADQVIGHVSGTRVGAAAHYLHHTYDAEKQGAMQAWSEHLLARLTVA